MYNTEKSFLNGFIKRAAEYGLSEKESLTLIKLSGYGNLIKRLGSIAASVPKGMKAFPQPLTQTVEAINPARQNLANAIRQTRQGYQQAAVTGKLPTATIANAENQYRTAMHGLVPRTNPLAVEDGVRIFNKPLTQAANMQTDWEGAMQKNFQNYLKRNQPAAPVEPVAKKRGWFSNLFSR
jgi:hypothetical protein